MMSLNTNTVMTRTPMRKSPRGKKISAPALTPIVPTQVTQSGLTPSRSSRSPSGAHTLDQNCRKRSSIGLLLGPGGREHLAGVAQQLRHGLGVADDRQEVRVAAPARHDVLMQVCGDARAGDVALVDAQVEPVRARDLA